MTISQLSPDLSFAQPICLKLRNPRIMPASLDLLALPEYKELQKRDEAKTGDLGCRGSVHWLVPKGDVPCHSRKEPR